MKFERMMNAALKRCTASLPRGLLTIAAVAPIAIGLAPASRALAMIHSTAVTQAPPVQTPAPQTPPAPTPTPSTQLPQATPQPTPTPSTPAPTPQSSAPQTPSAQAAPPPTASPQSAPAPTAPTPHAETPPTNTAPAQAPPSATSTSTVPNPTAPAPQVSSIELVESAPIETTLDHADIPNAADVWLDMINSAQKTLDFAEFYASGKPGSRLDPIESAVEKATLRGVHVRFLCDESMSKSNYDVLDRFATTKTIEMRLLPMKKLAGGVLHAKYFLVDGREAYFGSQNFDWRSLDQIQELGLRVRSSAVTSALQDVFAFDWSMATSRPLPPAPPVPIPTAPAVGAAPATAPAPTPGVAPAAAAAPAVAAAPPITSVRVADSERIAGTPPAAASVPTAGASSVAGAVQVAGASTPTSPAPAAGAAPVVVPTPAAVAVPASSPAPVPTPSANAAPAASGTPVDKEASVANGAALANDAKSAASFKAKADQFHKSTAQFPELIGAGESAVKITPVFSPKDWLPDPSSWDLPHLIEMIDAAKSTIRVQLLTYKMIGREYWSELELALRRAAARNVSVQLLVADWCQRGGTIEGLQSLETLPNFEVKLVTIPQWSGGFIPYARVIHAKYMVVDGKQAWIGTGNWERDYFYESRNVGLIIDGASFAQKLVRFFKDDWTSPYATFIDPCATYEAPKIGD